ncbi:class I ribonucleotide reductase maintenance protein YfaE [Pseudoalteromonas sp. MMG012]|uniref:class I ribonucleotide reductase maintenance protein YfaE n=1 Tax=Pseudoalteromonas sp. MMG012 TaxID=2822686 RepID=UPI001B39CE63|nr:class I ribonucleotide reductase maintenance protein YfaE [Pseudoalteromonas sp. MMG012]MBQ4848831.1 2Fe-2S ferredoxin-like protein [Pseudoalteromonas sp. MMG012]
MVEKPYPVITITDHDEPLEFVAHSPTLLHTLEAANIDVPYQCREGFCGACRAQLNEGKITYNQEPLAFVREGEILLCCSRPLSNIKITLL